MPGYLNSIWNKIASPTRPLASAYPEPKQSTSYETTEQISSSKHNGSPVYRSDSSELSLQKVAKQGLQASLSHARSKDEDSSLMTAVKEEDKEESVQSDDEVFAVETIKDHAFDENGNLLFLVKWLGYDQPGDDSWEPEENLLEGSEELRAEYFKKIGGRPRPPTVTPKKSHKRKTSSSGEGAKKSTKRRKSSTSGSLKSNKASSKSSIRDEEKVDHLDATGSDDNFLPPGSWEGKIKIKSVSKQEDGSLAFNAIWLEDQEEIFIKSPIMKAKAPLALIDFYESNLTFHEVDDDTTDEKEKSAD